MSSNTSTSTESGAHVFSYTDSNIDMLCHSYESETKPLIVPTYTTYCTVAPMCISNAFHKWDKMINKFAPTSIMIYHETHFPAIAKLTTEETELIKSITEHFWTPDSKYELSIMVPPREDIHPTFRQPNGKIIVDHSFHPVLQKLQECTQSPLAVQPVYVNQIPCTAYGHFEAEYQNEPVHILKQEEPCKRGVESTLIDIDTNKKVITFVRVGHISIDDFMDYLEETPFSNYHVELTTQPSNYINTIRPLWNRRIYRTQWISCPLEQNQIDELSKSTKSYLANSIFIDYGKQNAEMASISWGYVDISEHNEIAYSLLTFYDILHQLFRMNSIHPILFYNPFSMEKDNPLNGLAAALITRIWNIESTNEELYIPYECILSLFGKTTLYHEKTKEEREADMEEVD